MVTTSKPKYKVIGTRPVRPDGIDKVTGRAAYGADIHLPGMLYGRVMRSPHAHAVIKSIDTSKALALPGVKAVVTAADFCAPGKTVADAAATCASQRPRRQEGALPRPCRRGRRRDRRAHRRRKRSA